MKNFHNTIIPSLKGGKANNQLLKKIKEFPVIMQLTEMITVFCA